MRSQDDELIRAYMYSWCAFVHCSLNSWRPTILQFKQRVNKETRCPSLQWRPFRLARIAFFEVLLMAHFAQDDPSIHRSDIVRIHKLCDCFKHIVVFEEREFLFVKVDVHSGRYKRHWRINSTLSDSIRARNERFRMGRTHNCMECFLVMMMGMHQNIPEQIHRNVIGHQIEIQCCVVYCCCPHTIQIQLATNSLVSTLTFGIRKASEDLPFSCQGKCRNAGTMAIIFTLVFA
jgi:hypothetical protein